MIFPLSCPAAAEGLVDVLEDVDSSENYKFDSLLSTRANDHTLFGVEFSTGAWGGYVNGISVSDMTFPKFLPIFHTALTNIDTAIQSSAMDMSWVGWGPTSWGTLFDYLDRYRLDNENIQNALGWKGTGNKTIWQLLDDLRTNLLLMFIDVRAINSSIQSGFSDLNTKVTDGFGAVNTRQDTAFNWQKGFLTSDLWTVYFYNSETGRLGARSVSGYKQFAQVSQAFLANALMIDSGSMLSSSGGVVAVGSMRYFSDFVRHGFLGLSANLAGSDKLGSFTAWRGPDQTAAMSANNILDMLALLGAELQGPLAKLQYVWADDDDIRISDKNQPVKDKIEENFVGDGEAAVKPSDIGGMADVSSQFKGTFSGAGSIGDIFTVLGGSGGFGFFSQEVASVLEPPQVVSPSVRAAAYDVEALIASDPDFWSQYDIDERGCCVPKNSLFDVSSYLEGFE